MKTKFDNAWKEWIRTNVESGQDKNGLFKILLDEGYHYNAIKKEMHFEPSIAVDKLVNPFKASQERQELPKNNSGKRIDPNRLYFPNGLKLETDLVEFYVIENYLNTEECEKIINLIDSKKYSSKLTSPESDNTFRTSTTCDLGTLNDPFMSEIDQRISKTMGIHPSFSEVIQGQYYEIGQEFKAHTDYFELNEIDEQGKVQGQRTYTFMIYLNAVEEGGETVFPKLDARIKPTLGTAIIWNSLNSNGSTNANTLHHAMPVTKGYKAIITKWFRSGSSLEPAPKMLTKDVNEFVPNFTKIGFLKQQLPNILYQKILDFYNNNKKIMTDEYVEGDFIINKNKSVLKSSSLIDLSDELRIQIHDVMKPLLETWCGQLLDPTYVYGIRCYHNKAILKEHRDRLDTHIISAIINVDQDTEEDWELHIDDNYYRPHRIVLKPGEMVFYESARLKHGRPIALNGNSYSNIFCHFKPVDYIPAKLK